MIPIEIKFMQRALRNMLMTENGTEKLDNELITTLFENITTHAQLHQLTRAEGKNKQGHATYPKETSHNSTGHGIKVPPATRSTDCSPNAFLGNVTTLD